MKKTNKFNIFLIILLFFLIVFYTIIQSGKEGYGIMNFITDFGKVKKMIDEVNDATDAQSTLMSAASSPPI